MDRAIEMSPHFAMTYYWRGVVLVRAGRSAEARGEFQTAVDLDIRTHRITSRLENAFIETMESAEIDWVDLRPSFHRVLNTQAAAGWFTDFVHPTERGHREIADLLAPPARRLLQAEKRLLSVP